MNSRIVNATRFARPSWVRRFGLTGLDPDE